MSRICQHCGAEREHSYDEFGCPRCRGLSTFEQIKLQEEDQARRRQASRLEALKQRGACMRCEGSGECAECKGSGRCAPCKGKGKRNKRVASQDPLKHVGSWFGVTDATDSVEADCEACQATGECAKCEATGECGFCRGSGFADPNNAPQYWIVKGGIRYDVSTKLAADFRTEARGVVVIKGVEVVQSGSDLTCWLDRRSGEIAVCCGFNKDQVIVLTPQATDAGLLVNQFKAVKNKRDKTVAIAGTLTATKFALDPNNVVYRLAEIRGAGRFGDGQVDMPPAQVGETVEFRVPCPDGVRVAVTLSAVGVVGDQKPGSGGSRPVEAVGSSGEDWCTFTLTRTAVAAGIIVKSSEPVVDDLDHVIGVSGLLTATKTPLRAGQLKFRVQTEYGFFPDGTVESPDAQVGQTVPFRIIDDLAFEGVSASSPSRLVIKLGVKASEDGVVPMAQAAELPVAPTDAPSSSQWYYAKEKQKLGPFTTEQLGQLALAGLLRPTDMVLREGASQWVQAATVGDLTFPASTQPAQPPLPPPPPVRWYYARAGQTAGPVLLEELRNLVAAGQLQPADFVIREGNQTWVPVSSVPELSRPAQ